MFVCDFVGGRWQGEGVKGRGGGGEGMEEKGWRRGIGEVHICHVSYI